MRTKIRTQQIVIDLPTETAEPWIRATLQEVFKNADWETKQTVDCFGAVHRHINEFATQVVTIEDPVLGTMVSISGAGLAIAITEMVTVWILQDIKNTRINEHNEIEKD